jgi:hypothetical protein
VNLLWVDCCRQGLIGNIEAIEVDYIEIWATTNLEHPPKGEEKSFQSEELVRSKI